MDQSSSSSTSCDSPERSLEPSFAADRKRHLDALFIRNKRKYHLYMKTYPNDVFFKKLRYDDPGGLECGPSSAIAAPQSLNEPGPSTSRETLEVTSNDRVSSSTDIDNIHIDNDDSESCVGQRTRFTASDDNFDDDHNVQDNEWNNDNNEDNDLLNVLNIDNERASNSDDANSYDDLENEAGTSFDDSGEYADDTESSISSNDSDPDEDSDEQSRPFSCSRMADLCLPLTLIPNVTAKDILLITIAIAMRHHFTHEAILTMLSFMNSITVHSGLPTTKKRLWKSLSKNESITTRHMFCCNCKGYIGSGKVPEKQCPCKACGPTQDNRSMSTFIQLSLISQLRELLTIPGIGESLRYRFTRIKKHPDAIEDIYDGAEYRKKSLPDSFLSTETNFSFTINTDGASVSNSSRASAWPVLLTINELPPHARKRHMLLAGVWVDVPHPPLNSLLLPIVKELKVLYEEGISWKPDGIVPVVSKFVTLICSVDTIARAAFLRMTQFNGMYGCSFCYAPGRTLPGKGPHRTYPVEDIVCRTDEEIRTHMNQAFDEERKVFGVKGPSVLLLLPEFDLALGVIVENMHSLYLGVIKQVTELIIFGKADQPWYAGSPKQCALINKRLMKIRPPSRISRKPRAIETAKQWKASEWRNWLLYYCLSCIDGIVKKPYLDHLALLSRAAYTLNKDSINLEELQEARLLLTQYLQDFQDLFGQENMSFNVHLLNHLADTVHNWGPLWAHSAFPFESWNKRIIDAVTSANSRPVQIVTRFLMARFVDTITYDPTIRPETARSIYSILHGKKEQSYVHGDGEVSTNFHGLGREEIRNPCDSETRALRIAGYECENLQLFKRAKINGTEYRCRGEKEATRFCNKFVLCKGIGFGEIVKIVQFYCNSEHTCGIFIESLQCIGDAFRARHIKNVVTTKNIVFLTVESIERPVLTINTPKGLRAIALPNVWETD